MADTDKILETVFPSRGAIAQLGERIVRNDEVVGSIPTSSTTFSITCGTARRHLPVFRTQKAAAVATSSLMVIKNDSQIAPIQQGNIS